MIFNEPTECRIIIELNEPTYSTKIGKKINAMYSTVTKHIKELKIAGIIQDIYSDNKRIKMIELTEKGKEIRRLLIKLRELVKNG